MNNLGNINEEDENLSVTAKQLSKINAANPFRASENYFESFTQKLQDEIEVYKELKFEAPVMTSIPKYNPFEVPSEYFEELPMLIQEKVVNAKSGTSILEWIYMLIKPKFALPFILTMFMAVAGMKFMNTNSEIPLVANEELTTDELLYVIDEGTIIETLNSGQPEEIASADEETIKSYLLENNIEESKISNE